MEGRVLKVRQVGDPVLFSKAEEVDLSMINKKEIKQIIEDLKETMFYQEGCLGLAAPQIGINKRIIVIHVDKEKCCYQDSEDVPTTVIINPKWRKLSDDMYIEYEGCASVPELRGKVERYKNIEVTYYTEKGEKKVKKVSGFTARDIQHECDHLDGIIFLDKVISSNGFATKDMVKKFDLRNENNG